VTSWLSVSELPDQVQNPLPPQFLIVGLYPGNILRGGINTAPALQAQAHELQKNMLVDNLEHKIQSRPSPERLIKQGILDREEDPRSP
jgi:hypothetical protein